MSQWSSATRLGRLITPFAVVKSYVWTLVGENRYMHVELTDSVGVQ